MTEPNGIYKKILAMLADVEPITKAQKNKDQGFMFRGIDDVYDALHPLLIKHGIICIPRVIEHHTEEYTTGRGTVMHRTTVVVDHRFYCEDGSYVSAITVGASADAGDKSAAKAQSVAFKYAFFETFCIPTGDADPDAKTPEGPARARGVGRTTGGPRVSRDQITAIWDAGTATAEGLGVDRKEVMRAILKHFQVTRTENIPRAQFPAVLAKVKDPGDLIEAKPEDEEKEGSNDDDSRAGE